MTRVDRAHLPELAATVGVPAYDPATVRAGIAHLGVGGFHRAHQAMYVDALLNLGQAQDWGIHGIGVQPSNWVMRDALAAQDNLYTLVARHNDGTWTPRVIGSITGYSLATDNVDAVVERLSDPRIRVLTITVTEGGYNLDPITGRFDPESQLALDELHRGNAPTTVFGLLVEALARRRERAIPACTVVSCDNIQGNGHVTADAVTSFARLRDPDLASWITDEVRFPNSMVDRITPQTTDDDRVELADRFGVEDRWPVVCEPYTQWILEDDFTAGRPPLQDVGVQLVDDVEPYELMKLRMLNASHQALAYPARVLGYQFVHDAAGDPDLSGFLLDYMLTEAIPTLRPVPGVDLHDYAHELIRRFANPEVRDTVARLCANTSDLIPKFLLPVVRAQLAANRPALRSVAVIAFWARFVQGVDEQGGTYEIDDALAPRLRAAAVDRPDRPTAFLDDNRALFGDLVDDPVFRRLYSAVLRSIRQRGVRATLVALTDDSAGTLR